MGFAFKPEFCESSWLQLLLDNGARDWSIGRILPMRTGIGCAKRDRYRSQYRYQKWNSDKEQRGTVENEKMQDNFFRQNRNTLHKD